MSANGDVERAGRLDEVLRLVRAKVAAAQRPLVEDFVVRYFQDVDPEDLAERQPADLYGAALSHWNFARKREPGQARVRVFNPTLEEHGWQSTHTIVEIVNDDMPFLVDSVSMAVNRQGLGLHLVIHPVLAVERDGGGTLVALRPRAQQGGGQLESMMHLEIDRIVDAGARAELAAGIERVLADVRAAVDDWG
ncbi:MAG TPA: NAD-glutamate dehydrogenase, partial [Casimicrobiaceae bacterium]|nr:NAD-glutamate dehydrogenase [Casimicrobiaceae bacterium]